MQDYTVMQSRRFARQFKKLHNNTKKCVETEVRLLIANPLLGTPKKGDLGALRVHKFYCQNQHYLLGYCVDDIFESIILSRYEALITMTITNFLKAIKATLDNHADEVAGLDQAIGDGDHLINLQRGLDALIKQADELNNMALSAAFSKIGMTLMSTMGGASGSLFGSMFVSMGKAAKDKPLDFASLVTVFAAGVESIKARGKADIGEKTMLDTLIPAMISLNESVAKDQSVSEALSAMKQAAEQGMRSTQDMLATKGRASFLGERARGHIDAGARTSQLMLFAIADVLLEKY